MRNIILLAITFVTAGVLAAESPAKHVALRTTDGFYLTAEEGGGSSVHTDRKELGPWETFVMESTGPGLFSFKAEKGTFLSDLASNERRAAREPRTMMTAMKRRADAASQFRIVLIDPDKMLVALMTSAGKYVTAENNGGVKARGSKAIATDRTEIGPWETFELIDLDKAKP